MRQKLLILVTLVAFVLAGPAMAVKRVPKSDDRPSIDNQKPDRAPGSSDQKAPSDSPKKQRDDKRGVEQPKRESRPERANQPAEDSAKKDHSRERDRFIDENDDGLNDRYKKPPEVVKRKKESDDSEKKEPSRERRDK